MIKPYFLLFSCVLLANHAIVFGQSSDNTPTYHKALGGRGSLLISGNPEANTTLPANHRQTLSLSPYLLIQKNDINRQKVIGLQVQVDNFDQRTFFSTNFSSATINTITTTVSGGMTLGERRRIYTANKFFGAAEYGVGPQLAATYFVKNRTDLGRTLTAISL